MSALRSAAEQYVASCKDGGTPDMEYFEDIFSEALAEESTNGGESTMNSFEYELGQKIVLAMSGEVGQVIGRAEYSGSPNSFYVRYVAADGCQRETWLSADAIQLA